VVTCDATRGEHIARTNAHPNVRTVPVQEPSKGWPQWIADSGPALPLTAPGSVAKKEIFYAIIRDMLAPSSSRELG
jgi:hypothetical protein